MERKIIIKDNKEIEIDDGNTKVVITHTKDKISKKPSSKKVKSQSNETTYKYIIAILVLVIVLVGIIAFFPNDNLEALNNAFSVLSDLFKSFKRAK